MSLPTPPSPTRQSERKPVCLQLRLAFDGVDQFVERYATNISEGGIFIRSRDPRPVGSRLKFELRLRSGEVAFEGEGIVRWAQGSDASGSSAAGMGLQFDTLSEESRALLRRILEGRGPDFPELVDGANPACWRPLSDFPPPPPEFVPEEIPEPPPVLAPAPLPASPETKERATLPLSPGSSALTAHTASLLGLRAPLVSAPKSRLFLGLELGAGSLRLCSGDWSLTVPAAVALSSENELVFGEKALALLEEGRPGARGLGALLGTRPGSKAAKTWTRRYLQPVESAIDGSAALRLGARREAVARLVERLLQQAVQKAEESLGGETAGVVLVSGALGESRRRAVHEVAAACGYPVGGASSASCLSVLDHFGPQGQRRVLVVDLEEGRLEVSVVEQKDASLSAVATRGSERCAGVELDLLLLEALLSQFEKDAELLVPEEPGIFERVLQASKEAREALGTRLEHEVFLPQLVRTGLSSADLQARLSRARLQTLASAFVERVVEEVREVLQLRGLGPRELDALLLVGEYARLPSLGLRLSQWLGLEPAGEASAVRAAARLASEQVKVSLRSTLADPVWLGPSGGSAKRLLERGLSLPAERQWVAVAAEGTRAVELALYQGEEPDADSLLGILDLGPLPLPLGEDRARVTVSVRVEEDEALVLSARAPDGEPVPFTLDRTRLPL